LFLSCWNLFLNFLKFINKSLLMIISYLNIKYIINSFITDSNWNESVWIISHIQSLFSIKFVIHIFIGFFNLRAWNLNLLNFLNQVCFLNMLILILEFYLFRLPRLNFEIIFFKQNIIFFDIRITTKTVSFNNKILTHLDIFMLLIDAIN
jgi:hypothetical protein